MRLFIAIDIPKEIKDKLFDLQKQIGSDLAKISWVHKKNLHLTLKFLGELPENKVEGIKERLRTIKLNSFEVELNSLGVFPNENRIRVIWVGLKSEHIYELQIKIDQELLDLFSKDTRFQSHLTLGRVKFIKNKEKLKEKLKLKCDGRFFVKKFKLIKSSLTREGPIYETIEEYKLK